MPWQRRRLLAFRDLRSGLGCRYLDRSDFSCWSGFIFGCIFIDWLWLYLLQTIEGRKQMHIAVWRCPKALRGVFRWMFRVKA